MPEISDEMSDQFIGRSINEVLLIGISREGPLGGRTA